MSNPERAWNDMHGGTPAEEAASRSEAILTPSLSRWLAAAFCLLCLIGIGLSAELTAVHYRSHTDPLYKPLCAVSDGLNCETVALSPYSVCLGVPVSVWGLVGYLGCLPLAVWGVTRSRPNPAWPFGLLSCYASLAVAISGVLAYLAYFRIRSVCLYCSGTYVVNLLLLGVAITALAKLKLGPLAAVLGDLRSLAKRPRSLVALALPVAVCVGSLLLFWPPYWKQAEAHESKPMTEGATHRGEHWIGADQPKLVIVEYTDYQCPFCRRAHRIVRDFVSQHAGQVRLVHKHFPLDHHCNPLVTRPFHPRACQLSRFASCAGAQGRFWEANDAILAALDTKRAEELDTTRIGAEVGLDTVQLGACMTAGSTEVTQDIQEGLGLEVSATPTYFIGGDRYEGAVPPEVLEKAWVKASASSATPAPGTPSTTEEAK